MHHRKLVPCSKLPCFQLGTQHPRSGLFTFSQLKPFLIPRALVHNPKASALDTFLRIPHFSTSTHTPPHTALQTLPYFGESYVFKQAGPNQWSPPPSQIFRRYPWLGLLVNNDLTGFLEICPQPWHLQFLALLLLKLLFASLQILGVDWFVLRLVYLLDFFIWSLISTSLSFCI